MSAAVADDGGGGGSDGNRRPVRPSRQGTVTPIKAGGRESKPRGRGTSQSPGDSVVTTSTASSRGGDAGVEELQQQTNGKKPRLVWTSDLHAKFVRAYESLGEREAVPKQILAVMNVSGLTREHVASHLQKYRQNLGRKGQSGRRRGNYGGATGPFLQPAFPQAHQSIGAAFPQAHQSVEAAFPQAPSPSPPVNPRPPPQVSFAPANMSHPQIRPGQGQIVQAPPPNLVHQRHENFPAPRAPAPAPQLFYPPPQRQAGIEQRRNMIMQQQAQAQHAAMVRGQAAVAMNYELGAQTLARAPAATGAQSHRLQQSTHASRAANASGGLYYPVPEASTRDERTEVSMGVAQQQTAAEAEARQVPAAGPAFAGPADPDAGQQQEESSDVLRFWNTASAPSMDHEFPPNQPT